MCTNKLQFWQSTRKKKKIENQYKVLELNVGSSRNLNFDLKFSTKYNNTYLVK